MTLQEIEKLTKDYAAVRGDLRARVKNLNDELEYAKKRALPGIKKAVELASASEAELRQAIKKSPELFKRPRSVVLHGIKVGFQKAKGQLEWLDDAVVVKAIKKLFGENWENFVKVTEKPSKKALENLPASELKRLGITVSKDTDEVLIKSTDSDIDKLVSALLKPSQAEEESEE